MRNTPRQSRWARALVILAGLFMVAASFGLHPEPGLAGADSTGTVTLSAHAAVTTPSHECPFCLAHRPVPLAPPAGVVLRPQAILLPVAAFVARLPERLEVRPRQNRAPPDAS